MGFNLEKIQQQQQELAEKLNRGGGSRATFWRPEDGKNEIRIMPNWTDQGEFSDQFWREVHQHWNINPDQRGPILCPKKTPGLDNDCPICEFGQELKDSNDPESQTLFKKVRAKVSYLLNIVDQKDPEYSAADVAEFKKNRPDSEVPFEVGDPKVQVYACPSTIFSQLLSVITDNATDITDHSKGHNVFLHKFANKDKLKTRYQVTLALKATESGVSEDAELPALDKVGYVMDYEKIRDLLVEGVGADFTAALPSAPSEKSLPVGSSDDSEDLEAQLRAQLSS